MLGPNSGGCKSAWICGCPWCANFDGCQHPASFALLELVASQTSKVCLPRYCFASRSFGFLNYFLSIFQLKVWCAKSLSSRHQLLHHGCTPPQSRKQWHIGRWRKNCCTTTLMRKPTKSKVRATSHCHFSTNSAWVAWSAMSTMDKWISDMVS